MNDALGSLWTGIIWTINGLLVIVYYAADHILSIALAAVAGSFAIFTPNEQRTWATGSSVLAVIASLASPAPVPLFLLVISLAGWAGQWLEQYNRPAQGWSTIRALALYALMGMGFALYRKLGLGDTIASDPMMTQGAGYLNAIIGIAMYIFPLGFLGYLAQSIWAHPPAPGTPAQLITKVRTRGQG